MNRLFLVEYYKNDPITGTTGWTIEFAWVYADNKKQAREKVKAQPHFDCVITCEEAGAICHLHMGDDPQPPVLR